MTFDDILAQIIDLLQRQGRVSYGALKRRFDLNDDYLNDLKDELLFAHPVVDEDNRGLVWTGETASGQEVTSHRAQPPQQPSAQHDQPTQITPSLEPYTPEAERRQLTVMFCDLVDSTTLSSQLDPEEYRDVVRAYQQVCSEVITRFDGHIAQLLGDGLLVYFGYPHAHEDDAHRAVHAGLDMLAALGDLNKGLQQAKGVQLAIRLGIHTGLVVVGEMGGVGRQEQLALGEVPNVCARIQGRAAPNTVAISEATYRLVQGYFDCEALGEQTLRGVAQPLQVYRVLQASGARGRLDVAVTRGLTPLVGRESEVTLLLERWAQVKDGQGQVVLLSGDAGIGKSRLVQMLKEHVANEPHTRWECRSSEYYQNTALFPLVDLFQRIWRFEAHETPNAKLEKLEHTLRQYRLPLEESVPLFAPVLSVPMPENHYPPLNLSPQRQRQKTLETIVTILLELAEYQPVLFILEDLHWTDPTTLEWLNLLIDQTPTASLLVLLTCRPHFQPAWHHRSYLTEMTLHRLSHVQVEQIVTGITDGKAFPAAVLQQIIAKTDGVPLFVEEMTKALLESGHLKEVDSHYELIGSLLMFAIPATLQDSLMARLDRLVTAKAVAQYAAVIGRQFSYALLQAVSQLDEAMLEHELGRLVEAEIVYQRRLPPQTTYTFKHALIQDAAYQSLLRSTRQQYHQRIAQVLEAQFPETAETQPELLAYHYTEAGLIGQAMPYWQRAGQRAIDRSTYTEAIGHLSKGLEVLSALPETRERAQHELPLQTALGLVFTATKGHSTPEVGQTYARARALCQQVDDPRQISATLAGLRRFYLTRGELQAAREVGEQLLRLAQDQHDTALLLWGHFGLGAPLYHLGELTAARTHLERGIALYDPVQHRGLAFHYGADLGVICRSWSAMVLWHLGYPAQSLQRNREALTLARELSHPFSLFMGLNFVINVHQFRREAQVTLEHIEALETLAVEHGFQSGRHGKAIILGWALAEQGQVEEGIRQMRQALASGQEFGSERTTPYHLALLAAASGKAGQTAEGLTALDAALALVHKNAERYVEAELYRLQGDLLLQQSAAQQEEAAARFQQALAVARHQQAKSLELRAAMSLARLWQQQGKQTEARALLAPVYGWFTEGFDTADLKDAKALLEELA